ncbi:hypothetical protein RCO48_30075 [Peribacillus frigoritolerans]|nr:hypothetical protein [Peribacillus frigoritolerans]
MKIKTASEIETAIDNAQIDWSGEYSAAFYYKESRDVDIKSFFWRTCSRFHFGSF